jgi:hypothetical protein
MKNQHLPFEHLEQIRDWVDSNYPLSNNAHTETERRYREATQAIATLRNMSMPVPNELVARAHELEEMLRVPDEETEIFNHLANELIALAKHNQSKQPRSQYRQPGSKTKAPPKTLTVTLPDGQTICERKAIDTYVNALRYMDLDKCAKIEEVVQLGHPVVSRTRNERARAVREIDGYYIETHSNTPRKAEILKQYADRLDVPVEIEVE